MSKRPDPADEDGAAATAPALGVLLSAAGLSSASGCASVAALEVCLQPLPRLGASLRPFPNLVELSLLDVGLRSLPASPGLGASCPCLERLWLAGNALTGAFPPTLSSSSSSPSSSSPLRGLARLSSLCLRQNALESLDAQLLALELPSLASLSLGGNRLRRLDGLSALRRLTELQAPANFLERLPRCCSPSADAPDAASLPSLRVLNLAGNPSPASLRQLAPLAASFPALEELWLADPLWPEGCPAAALGGYASAALALLPEGLKRLDGLPVPEEARGLLRRELERRCFLVRDDEEGGQCEQQNRSLIERARAGLEAGASSLSSSSSSSSSSQEALLARATARARRALRRALRRAELDSETHGSVRIEEVEYLTAAERGLEALLRAESTLLPDGSATPAPLLPSLPALRVKSAARVRSRALANAFESRLKQRLLPMGTAYLGPGTPAVAAIAARGGVVPVALAAEGGAHVRTLLFVLPEGSRSIKKGQFNVDDDKNYDDRDMRALEAIAELGFVGAAAAEADHDDESGSRSRPWVRLRSSLPPRPSRTQNRMAVMVVRAYVGAEGKGHVRLRAEEEEGAAAAPPARLPQNGAVAVRASPDVWWHCDPSLVLPVALLELSFAEEDDHEAKAVVAAAAASAAAAPSSAANKDPSTTTTSRAILSPHSLQIALSAVQRELEPWIALGDAAFTTSNNNAPAIATPLAPWPPRPEVDAGAPGLVSLDLSGRGLSGEAPELWCALSNAQSLTRLELNGNRLTGFPPAAAAAATASATIVAPTAATRFPHPLLPALRVLGLESNRLVSLEGLDRVAGPLLEQLHARDNPALASPAAALAPLSPAVLACFAAAAGPPPPSAHPFPRLEVLDLRGSAVARGDNVPAGLCVSSGLPNERGGGGGGGDASPFGPQQQQQQERARDYRLYALYLLHAVADQQHPRPQLLVLDGRAVTAGERDEAARCYRGVLTREALGGGGTGAATSAASLEQLSLQGWRLRSTGGVFARDEDEEEGRGGGSASRPQPPLLLPGPAGLLLQLLPSRLVDLDLSGNRLTAINPQLAGLVRLTRLVLDDNRLGGGGSAGGNGHGPTASPLPHQHPLSFERTLAPRGNKRSSQTPLFPALVTLSLDRNGLASLAPLRLGSLHRSLRRLSARGNALSALEEEDGDEEKDETVSSRSRSLAALTGLEELLLDGNRLRRWRDTGAVLAAVAAAAAAGDDDGEDDGTATRPSARHRPLLRLGLSDNGIRSLRDMPLLERVWELRVGEAREGRVLADPSDADALAAAAPALRSVWIVSGGGEGSKADGGNKRDQQHQQQQQQHQNQKQQQQEEQQRQVRQQRQRQQRVLLAARCGSRLERVDGIALTPPEREAAAMLTAAERAAAAAAAAALAEGGDASAAASAAARAASAVVAAVVSALVAASSASVAAPRPRGGGGGGGG